VENVILDVSSQLQGSQAVEQQIEGLVFVVVGDQFAQKNPLVRQGCVVIQDRQLLFLLNPLRDLAEGGIGEVDGHERGQFFQHDRGRIDRFGFIGNLRQPVLFLLGFLLLVLSRQGARKKHEPQQREANDPLPG